MRRWIPRGMVVVSLAALAVLVLLASACGGSATPRVAAIGTTTTQSSPGQRGTVGRGSPVIASGGTSSSAGTPSGNSAGRESFALVRGSVGQMTKFATCVRSHGEPNFPDPNPQGQFSMTTVTAGGIDPRSPQLGRAVQACQKDLPKSASAALSSAAQAQARQQGLALAACMRSHGVPNFRDPSANGNISVGGSGIDPQSPQYQTATTACRQYLSKNSKLGAGTGR